MVKTARMALIGFALGSASSFAFATPVVHTTDFIADNARTHFNGFEAIPTSTVFPYADYALFYTGGSGPYVEGGMSVRQVNPDPDGLIWVVNYSLTPYEGNRAWYPNGGSHQNSYTEIGMADGSSFSDFGFYFSSGGYTTLIYFDLLSNGTSVLSGSIPAAPQGRDLNFEYLGFSGGGFDTIRVRDNLESLSNPWSDPAVREASRGSSVYDGWTSLMIDALETGSAQTPEPSPVPEPGAVLLFGLALVALQLSRGSIHALIHKFVAPKKVATIQ